MKRSFAYYLSLLLFLSFTNILYAQQIISPKEHFGFHIGDDYQLTDFTSTEQYFKKLAEQSDRVKYVNIGKTENNRDQPMLIISSAENLKNLEKFKSISTNLARAKMTEDEAKKLAQEGKSVVWIDGGLHSNEVVATNQLIQTAYTLASSNSDETKKILDNCIVLLVHANPDGHELVGNWYMREKDPTKRSTSYLPVLYQKYAGHDNNRDFFMLNLKESQNMARQLFIEWIPQIMYNHHQTAPAGAVVAGAPYRDPFNYVFDPLLMSGIDALGAAMSSRLNAENKPGYTAKNGSVFSTWYNGGLRTTTYFHNMIGLLTEIIGNPTPFEIPLVPSRLLPSSNTQNPVLPQRWHFQQSIDYSLSLNYAVLGYASRYKDELLFNIYRMGKNSIERGSKDFWALSPSKVILVDSAQKIALIEDPKKATTIESERTLLSNVLNNANLRDPRAYIIPSNQTDFNTATKFVNALIQNGIEVQLANSDFIVAGKNYKKGSYIIKTNQAFRPHILDMFEPQDHPDDFEYPGGPPIPPYDAAGWTLAYLMDVQFDRILDDFNGPFNTLKTGEQITPLVLSKVKGKYLKVSGAINDSYKLANKLLNNKKKVWRDQSSGDFYLSNDADLELDIPFEAVNQVPKTAKLLKSLRIGLWDTYGGNMSSGWLRLILEQNNYKYTLLFPQQIDKGNLRENFDVIILPGNAIPRFTIANDNNANRRRVMEMPSNLPDEYKGLWGSLAVDKSIPILKDFIEKGGKIIATGGSSDLAKHLNLAVENALVDENKVALKRTQFYTPGSVLEATVNTTSDATWGYQEKLNIYYNNDNLFKINDDNIKPLIWFDKEDVLRSGWSWGEKYFKGAVLGFEASLGKGKLITFGNDITFRSQTHGSFKLLFNHLQ